jgi:hypothetical protein
MAAPAKVNNLTVADAPARFDRAVNLDVGKPLNWESGIAL